MERAQFERAKRDELRPRHRFFRKFVAFAVCLILVLMLVPVSKKQAKANPAAGALLVAACEAAGITVDEFALGMTAIITATTGISLIGAMAEYESGITIPPNQRHWNTPGWKDWSDMTPEEKQNTGVDNNYDYYLQWLQAYCIYYGYFNEGNQNPDPDDPEGPKFEENLVRMVKTLSITSGGIAMVNYRYPTDKGSYLFDDNQLAVPYQEQLSVFNKSVPMALAYKDDCPYDAWFGFIDTYGKESSYGLTSFWTVYSGNNFLANPYSVTINNNNQWVITLPKGNNYKLIRYRTDGTKYNDLTQTSVGNFYFDVDYKYFNPFYKGTYVFQNDGKTVTVEQNKITADDVEDYSQSFNYGQEQDTPIGLQQSVPVVPNLNEYLGNVDDGLDPGQSTYIVLPDLSQNNDPSYSDFVQVRNDDQTTTDPDNPVNPNPDPENPPAPTEEDFAERFSRIIAQPFEAAFPFCLIEDARQLFLKLEAAAPEPDFTVILPLADFEVDGAEEIELDASFLIDVGAAVKVGFNILWTAALIAFAYKLFLKRGE